MKPIEFLKQHCQFVDDYQCYVLLAVSRKKDTLELTSNTEPVFREVIKREDDIIRKYNKIKASIINYQDENGKHYPFYLYVSCNSRDSKKAFFILMKQMINWVEEETHGVNHSRQMKKIYGYFYSALMTKEARGKTKYFMIDYDSKKQLNEFLEGLQFHHIKIKCVQETRNGYHIIIEPFNRTLMIKSQNDLWEIKTDANIFIEYVEVKQ